MFYHILLSPRNAKRCKVERCAIITYKHGIQELPHELPKELRVWIECGFTLKRVRDMIRTNNQMHRTVKYSQHSSVIWSVWLNRLRNKWLWVRVPLQSPKGYKLRRMIA